MIARDTPRLAPARLTLPRLAPVRRTLPRLALLLVGTMLFVRASERSYGAEPASAPAARPAVVDPVATPATERESGAAAASASPAASAVAAKRSPGSGEEEAREPVALEPPSTAAPARDADGVDTWGQVARVPEPAGPHRVWVNDRVLRHSLLFDGDDGRMLGSVDSGLGLASKPPYLAPARGEVYVVETFYSRGQRGQRFDVVTVYDATTLAVQGDVELPPRVSDTGQGLALAAVLDGERFLAVLNQAPGSSVSIVDLEERRFALEVTTGGCAGIYPVGPRRFGMLCGDGTALLVELDEAGRSASLVPSERFFDVVTDPLTVSGVRDGERWLFASFEGWLHAVDFSGAAPRAEPPWSLLSASERSDEWRVGGVQHLAFHGPSRRLYSVVHQGGPGSHKDAGPEIWVYDVTTKQRVGSFDAPNVLFGFIRPFIGVEPSSFAATVLRALLPSPGVHSIAVTQDEAPVLFARNSDLGAVGVLDARSGDHLRDLEEVGLSGTLLVPVTP